MKKILLAISALLCASQLHAAQPNFNHVGASYRMLDFDCDTNCDGLALDANLAVNDWFHLDLDYTHINGGGGVDLAYLTGGFRRAVSDNTSIYGLAGIAYLDTDFGDDSEGVLGLGIRGMVNDSFETDFLVRRVIASGADVEARLTGTYYFTESFGTSLSLNAADGIFGGGLGLRLNF